MSVPGSRSRVTTRAARPADLPAVLALVRQHRAEAHAEGVLTGQTPGAAAAAGFRRLLADPAHRVVLAVLPGPNAPDGGGDGGEGGEDTTARVARLEAQLARLEGHVTRLEHAVTAAAGDLITAGADGDGAASGASTWSLRQRT